MAKPSEEITKKRGANVKKLIKWWKETHPEEKKTQADVAAHLGIDPAALSGKIKGEERYLNEEDARMIASFFPGARVEFILGYDEYITWEDRNKAIFDRMEDDAAIIDGMIRRIMKDKNCSIHLFKKGKAPEGMIIDSDSYAIIENNQVVGFISISDYIAIRHEITDFAKFIIGKKIETSKKQMVQSFPYKEEV